MTTAIESAQSDLAAIVGPSRVVTEESACRAAAVDEVAPKSVVYPQSAEQVAALLQCAAERDLALIPFRNATKLDLGNFPRRYDVALSLKDLSNVWQYDPEDLTASVEAGVKLGDLQHLLARHNLWLPLDPSGGARASLGGMLATNATGPLRLFYGAPRDMVVGMKIATTEGRIIKTGGRVVKNVAGYDLSKLLIGSYGTLGVIVEANLKLFPLPAERCTYVFGVSSLDVARELSRCILHSPLTPIRIVYIDCNGGLGPSASRRPQSAATERSLWVEAAGSKRVIERYARTLAELGRAAGATIIADNVEESAAGWDWVADLRGTEGDSKSEAIVLRASVPIRATMDFVAAAKEECESLKARAAIVAQPGSGVTHLCLPQPGVAQEAARLIESLRRAASALTGVLVVEHSPPEVKRQIDVWGPPGSGFELMRKLKLAWDPKGVLSPGRFLGGL